MGRASGLLSAFDAGGASGGACSSAARIRPSSPRRCEIAAPYGYDEINLNVGCPSDRVQSGTFGACLMLTPETVAACIAAMKAVSDRAGHGEMPDRRRRAGAGTGAADLLDRVLDAGADAIWIHARKAWLKGLSPKENREIPPLDYDIVYRMKQARPMSSSASTAASRRWMRRPRISRMSTASCSAAPPIRMPVAEVDALKAAS
jgi:hypothetical protein